MKGVPLVENLTPCAERELTLSLTHIQLKSVILFLHFIRIHLSTQQ